MASFSSTSNFAPAASETDSGRADVAMSDAVPASSLSNMATDSIASGSGATSALQDSVSLSPARVAVQRGIPQPGFGGPQKRRALGKMPSHRMTASSGHGAGTSYGYGEQGDWGGEYEDSVARRMGEEKSLLDERIRERYIRELGDIFEAGR
ncbi:unnamed protein product [Tilletia controversa]|uniref:Uncharacterized protein n=3 Tax=Tilletia TaxID=13289 RepID=A0A8X7SZH8_9BASI|nr:hypothetical protein CF336_g830 [Tilletia laevis]KAE8204091.1 hypothetical protein CF328_g1290 [Tilletia controversa]KAE8264551.1 hypothetical protein A4X03_0g864 [Tilletia caries]KAE8207993.1 hypothetical protein CF335_g746 [Tilletia laevis]KAE8253043.1 hypothetical protein A4X06_0g1741 [Tilletia controversa]